MMDNRQSSCQSACRVNNPYTAVNTNQMPRQTNNVPSRKELMACINEYSFAVIEATLFLDTHPYDTEALAYFQKYRSMRQEALQEYAKYYAPLVIDYAVSDKTPWSWANEPWPWEGVEC